ncbi:hypothetical protein [Blastopirellula marina]|uniref:Uncharacterized protein n=1 Tax=Blastopirellula marina TaxID=124 RepID=A0A2S8F6V1_9BACT|nr:hypothetical protein [Blastopirellula marina]PQO27868.1 hypothetical protein C5Y98_26435 [Blastopirellula marina]PTL41603.1 hypothetical protein C5Y97_26450 [Blastopirellula marina]
MGVDWIPCRAEPEIDEHVLADAVEREYEAFLKNAGWVHFDLWPLMGLDPWCSLEEHDVPSKGFRLADLLLFKQNSHRVSAVTGWEVLPLEWRLEAYRTILPGQLPAQFQQWSRFRAEVVAGRHRPYLERLFWYLRTIKLGSCLQAASELAAKSRTATASWTDRPEVIAARDNLLNLSVLPVPTPPRWDCATSAEDSLDQFGQELQQKTAHFQEAATQWNTAVKRGNWRIDLRWNVPEFDFEVWIQQNTEPGIFFDSFVEWVEPYLTQGYGLYRDCEA